MSEHPYKFIDSRNREYNFRIDTRHHFNSHLVLTKILYAEISYTIESPYSYYLNRIVKVSEEDINDIKMWRMKCFGLPEELRLYLHKFIKLPAFF
jgi:hypothetical protein